MVRFRVDLPRKKGISNRTAGRLMFISEGHERKVTNEQAKTYLHSAGGFDSV